MHIAVSSETILLVIKFRIGGSLRFLSHAETLRVFQRACVRAGIEIQHSQGFNPHPKLSLPLPRPVGVEADDELLCLRCSMLPPSLQLRRTSDARRSADRHPVEKINGRSDLCDLVIAGLSEQLPEGIELLSVNVAEAKTSFHPCSATYILKVHPKYLNGALQPTIMRLLANKSLFVTRASGHGPRGTRGVVKEVDVRGFLKSIELDNNSIIVQYEISPVGSIRIEEILRLLELDYGMLSAPIKRTNVQWQKV